jgi:iron(III) transport system substrate-binding protein
MAFVAPEAFAQPAVNWDAVVAAAKREGQVVVYSTYVSPTTHQAIGQAFERKYGIRVELLQGRGEIRERARIEQVSGRFLGDVFHTAITVAIRARDESQILQPLGALPGLARLKPEFARRADAYMAPIFTINYGILVNTRLVKQGDEPNGWLDLLDPKWQGKILADDPRASGGGRVMFHMTYDRFGRAFQEKLATQKLSFARDYQESVRRVARGEFPIYVPFILSEAANLRGLPVTYVIPQEGVTYGSYASTILKNPPHPNAARLMADFYLSDEAQEIYARSGHGITIVDLREQLAPDIAKLANVRPLVDEDFTRIDEMFAMPARSTNRVVRAMWIYRPYPSTNMSRAGDQQSASTQIVSADSPTLCQYS